MHERVGCNSRVSGEDGFSEEVSLESSVRCEAGTGVKVVVGVVCTKDGENVTRD